MSRTSRYSKPSEREGFAALYVRLSTDVGESIESQKEILSAAAKELCISSCVFYIDNGFTGANFCRPAFQRLMADIMKQKINCVLVKDFSRLGRNSAQVSSLCQIFFPTMRVRLISVADNFDSAQGADCQALLSMDLKNVLNEEYLKDCSIKSKRSYAERQSRGLFTAPFAPYGYKKTADHRLEIDTEVSGNVLFIFKDFVRTRSYKKVCDHLREKKILCPSAYKQKFTRFHSNKISPDPYAWSVCTVKEILSNIYYLGHTAQHRREVINFKTKKIAKLKRENWLTVRNTHPPIVDEKLFASAWGRSTLSD